MNETNFKLKGLIVERFGSQTAAARALNISEPRLSRVVRGWTPPRPEDLRAFRRIFGNRVKKILNEGGGADGR